MKVARLFLTCIGVLSIAACAAPSDLPEDGSQAQESELTGPRGEQYSAARGALMANRARALWEGRPSRDLCLAGVDDVAETSGAIPQNPGWIPRMPSAVAWQDYVNANPWELLRRGYVRTDLDVYRLPKGAIIGWRPSQCGYHSLYGHLEIVVDDNSSRACSDYCGAIPRGCGNPLVYIPVELGTTCPGGGGMTVGAIDEKYRAIGSCGSVLGVPTTEERGTPDGLGRYSVFERGSIYWTASTGANEVHGIIREKWATVAWETGPLGYPTTDEQATPDGVGRYNHFQRGSIYWTPSTGANELYGDIHDKWAELDYEKGPLGYPVSGEYAVDGLRRSDFERGSITWNSETRETKIFMTASADAGPHD